MRCEAIDSEELFDRNIAQSEKIGRWNGKWIQLQDTGETNLFVQHISTMHLFGLEGLEIFVLGRVI